MCPTEFYTQVFVMLEPPPSSQTPPTFNFVMVSAGGKFYKHQSSSNRDSELILVTDAAVKSAVLQMSLAVHWLQYYNWPLGNVGAR